MVSIVVPVLNEAASVAETLDRIRSSCVAASVPHEVIVVDDGSTDETPRILASRTDVRVLRHAETRGYGASLRTGIGSAQGDIIGMIDADGTYQADAFPRLLQELSESVDMVIGVRVGRSDAFPLLRRPGKFVINALAAFLVGKRIPDLNSGLRVFRRLVFDRFANLLPDGFSFTTTITLGALTNHLAVRWLPISYSPRRARSTITFSRGLFQEFPAFLTLIVRIITYFKPLRFFAVPSLLFLLLGLTNLTRTLLFEHNISDASILLVVVGIQIGLMGLIADLIVRSRGR